MFDETGEPEDLSVRCQGGRPVKRRALPAIFFCLIISTTIPHASRDCSCPTKPAGRFYVLRGSPKNEYFRRLIVGAILQAYLRRGFSALEHVEYTLVMIRWCTGDLVLIHCRKGSISTCCNRDCKTIMAQTKSLDVGVGRNTLRL